VRRRPCAALFQNRRLTAKRIGKDAGQFPAAGGTVEVDDTPGKLTASAMAGKPERLGKTDEGSFQNGLLDPL
jgi:hypothetical protein